MKILDSNFRKELYKSLMEAGYEKQEAQKIVGVKYFKSLKEKMLMSINNLLTDITENNFIQLSEEFINTYNSDILELQKMNEYLND